MNYVYIIVNIIYWVFPFKYLLNIFVGVLRDTIVDATSLGSTLSASQNIVFQYIRNIMSTMEPISNDYIEQELDENEQYAVSETVV